MQDNKRPQENERTVRDALHSRAFKNGAYASVLCAVMLALVVALNLFVGALPAKYLRYDMTENKLYSLSQENRGPVRGLNAGRNVLLPGPYRPGGCGRHRAAGQVQRRFIPHPGGAERPRALSHLRRGV